MKRALAKSAVPVRALSLSMLLTLASTYAWAAPSATLTLEDAIAGARTHDKAYLSSQTLPASAQALQEQADSLWRPQVMLNGAMGLGGQSTSMKNAEFSAPAVGMVGQSADFSSRVNIGWNTQLGVMGKQALYQPARRAQSEQLKLAAQSLQLQQQAAEQAMILRATERYFDAQFAQQNLLLLSAELQNTKRVADEAKYRFDIGNRPITEVYEAQARLAEIQAQQFQAQADVQSKLTLLHDTIGKPRKSLPNEVRLVKNLPKLESLEFWQERARQRNLELRLQSLNEQTAQAKLAEVADGAQTSVDLVGQLGHQSIYGQGNGGSASNRQNNAMIGVQVTLPLYSGGYQSAKQREAQAALDKARLDTQTAQERVMQQVQASWLGVRSVTMQIGAMEQGLKAALSRLDATSTGLEVGHRTTMDVLNATQQVSRMRLQLETAREQYVLQRMRLLALTQSLDLGVVKTWVLAP